MWNMAIMSRDELSMVHQSLIADRIGDSAPSRDIWATTAKTIPDSRARRLPVAESTSMRLAQARVSVMPQPNIRPPMIEPDRLPRLLSARTVPVSNRPSRISAWVAISAVAKANSQMASLSPSLAMRDFQRRRAQAEARPLRQRAEQHADEGAAQRQRIAVADEIDEIVQHHGLI